MIRGDKSALGVGFGRWCESSGPELEADDDDVRSVGIVARDVEVTVDSIKVGVG